MILENEAALIERVESLLGRRLYTKPHLVEDTSNYMAISNGAVLRLEGRDYFVTGEATEGRFGISEQPKYWVKYAYDLDDGSRKIIKFVFYESFSTTVSFFTFRLTRNPDKESKTLEAVAGDPRFMQGKTTRDRKGNNVRIIDYIYGDTLYNCIAKMQMDHEQYFHEMMPATLKKLVGSLEALAFLHDNGLQHGDVRNDHIIIEKGTGDLRWIDFDYEVNYGDYDVWSVGNILTYVVGMGLRTCRESADECSRNGVSIGPRDTLLMFKHRIANLRKLFPYIPADLNEMLMRFSYMTEDFYEDVGTIAKDLASITAQL